MIMEHIPTYDTVYIKFTRKKGVFNCPLCEILDGDYQGDYTIIAKDKTKKYTKPILQALIQRVLDNGQITDFKIQKKHEARDSDLQAFLVKYHI